MYVNDPVGCFDDIGSDCVKDVFGVTWDRSRDKDIGIVKGTILPQPTLKNYDFPNPLNYHIFENISGSASKVIVVPVLFESAIFLTLLFGFPLKYS